MRERRLRTTRNGGRWAAALAVAAIAAACGGEERSGERIAARSRAAARSMIWNVAPGTGASEGLPAGATLETRRSAVVEGAPTTLVLYDVSGPWGHLGELYGIGAANLSSRFGGWTAKPAAAYTCGEVEAHTATIYLGSTYDEPLPPCLLDDVVTTSRPVIWSFFNLWQVTARMGFSAFVEKYGWTWTALDFAEVAEVRYKGRSLDRYAASQAGILTGQIIDPAKATVLASAVRADGSTFPWAIRSGNLTFVGEIPFSYMNEEDRYLIFADLLFDALAPGTPERHRALVRLEDIDARFDPDKLRAIADYFYSERIPFGFGVVAEHVDPQGYYNGGVPLRLALKHRPELAAALRYMVARGGVIIMHGKTHQWSGGINPYTQVSGDDTEFYRMVENPDHTITYVGPLPEDSARWVTNRIDGAHNLIREVRLPRPAIFEFPHYAGSALDYRTVATKFTTRWDRTLYFGGVLRGGPVNHGHLFGQLFPFVVRDVYGTKVLPENLGNIEPEPFYIYPARSPAQIVRAAEKNLVVRDGFAAFYFHPFFDLALLRETVNGIRALGYTFVDPATL